MSTTPLKKIPSSTHVKSINQSSIRTISNRQSRELIIGFCGAIGAGIKTVKNTTSKIFEQQGYEVVNIRMSKLMEMFPDD